MRECYCGANLTKIELADPFLASAWGKPFWWRGEDGSALCYSDEQKHPGLSKKDRNTEHEPIAVNDRL